MDFDPAMSETLLTVLDACGIGAFVGDGQRLLDVNSSMCELFDREREEMLGLEPTRFLDAPDRSLMTERRANWRGDVDARVVSIVRPTSELVPALIASAAVREGVRVGVAVDLSELSAATFELEVFRTMADHSSAGVLVWDGQGVDHGLDLRLRWASLPVLRLLGANREAVVGGRLGDLLPFIPPVLADRALALCGTDHVEHLGEARLPAPGDSSRVLDRMLIGLPRSLVAVRIADITDERAEAERRYALLRRLVDLGDAERKRLAMDLHDDAIQQAAAAAVLLEGLARRPDAPDRGARVLTATGAVREIVASLRRLVFELSPPELVESGLDSALRTACEYLFGGTQVQVDFELGGLEGVAVPESLLTTTFRIAVEALTNVRKHARASRVLVAVEADDVRIDVRVRDDGVGLSESIDEPGHFGVRSMVERAAGLGGVCTVTSRSSGGVEVHAELPMDTSTAPPVEVPLSRLMDVEAPGADELASLRQVAEDATTAFARARDETLATTDRLESAMAFTTAVFEPAGSEQDILDRVTRSVPGVITGYVVFHAAGGDGGLRAIANDLTDPDLKAHAERLVTTMGHGRVALDAGVPFVFAGGPGQPHAVIAPMKVGGCEIGTLTILRSDPAQGFEPDDTALAGQLATQVAAAIRLARRG